jgi:twitching motility protein PilT
MIGAFPADEQHSIRQQVSLVLREVVAQRLVPRRQIGIVPAVEILKVTKAVSHLIRTGRSEQIRSVMEGAGGTGMRTLEQSLASLVASGAVSERSARAAAHESGSLDAWLKGSA